MAAHKYWRINVSANNGNTSNLVIREIEMLAVTGGADQCNGGTAFTSSTNGGNVASFAFDNGDATWATASGVTAASIGYQFTSPVSVAEYHIKSADDATTAPKNFTLEYSDDNVSWTVADTRTGITGWAGAQWRGYTVTTESAPTAHPSASPVVSHPYWRLNISTNNGNASVTTVREIEMRGTVGGADQCNGGTAFTSSTNGSNVASFAFDNGDAAWATYGFITAAKIGYQFTSNVLVAQYTVKCGDDPTAAPKDFRLEYSDDGVTWYYVDTQTSQTGWTASQIRTYAVTVTATAVTRPQVFVCT